jgi:ABC-type multidrug transport system permease subunit
MFKIANKDLKLFLKDRKALLLTLLIPIVLLTLFAVAFGSFGRLEESSVNSLTMDNQNHVTDSQTLSQETNWALIQSVTGVAVMMLLFSVASMGGTILAEKEQGTLKKLLYSPIRPSQILFGKMFYTLIISVCQLTILLLYSWIVFKLDIFRDIPSLVVIILSTAFACTGFGLLLASISKSRKQVESLSIIIILVMSAIGGSMVPLFLMPEAMQKMAIISVNYWAIQGFYDILGREMPFVHVFLKALILIGIGLILSVVSSIWFKRNILKVV